MKERPILFSTPMVQAILAGQKIQTRRVVKNELVIEQAEFECGNRPNVIRSEPCLQYWVDNQCPNGQIGDRLWVRETWSHTSYPFDSFDPESDTPFYRADYVGDSFSENGDPDMSILGMKRKWIPSIHMPRSACRLILEITKIRVERLNDISSEDAKAEGFDYSTHPSAIQMGYAIGAKTNFRVTWEQIYGQNEWNKNPWVWVVEFKVIQGGAL